MRKIPNEVARRNLVSANPRRIAADVQTYSGRFTSFYVVLQQRTRNPSLRSVFVAASHIVTGLVRISELRPVTIIRNEARDRSFSANRLFVSRTVISHSLPRQRKGRLSQVVCSRRWDLSGAAILQLVCRVGDVRCRVIPVN